MNIFYVLLYFILSFHTQIHGFLYYANKHPKKHIKIYKSNDNINKNCIVFFTGGSNSISHRIYDDFLKNVQKQNISVYVPSFNYEYMNYLIRILTRKYKKVIMIGHSSGCNTLLNNCNYTNIKNIILIDPVKTTFFNKKTFFLPYINSVLFIHAMKSYKISYNPYGLPFIPNFLRLQKKDIDLNKDNNIQIVEFDQYGHSDILNPYISNFMHYTRITTGHENRNLSHLHNYYSKITNLIKNIIDSTF